MGFVSNIPIGQVAYASMGTNTTDAIQLWVTDIFIPTAMSFSIVGFLQGGTATTDNTLVAVYDPGGNLITTSNLAGVVLSGGNTFQEQTLLKPVYVSGPTYLFIAIQGSSTTAGALQTIPTGVYVGIRAGSVTAGVFGTVPNTITVPQTFTTNKGPIVYVR